MSNLALVVKYDDNNKAYLDHQYIPIPVLGEHQALVKVECAAQNPTDVQSFDGNAFGEGAVPGCDFVGIVQEVGRCVTRITKGMRVAGLIWGGEIKGLGAYSEYTIADEQICFPVPETLSPEEACTVPLASCTALLGLFSKESLALNIIPEQKQSVLIWGGSSSVGLYAIQIASSNGFRVLTTCSKQHHELVKAYGAEHAFDYRDPGVVDKIRRHAPNLQHVFDVIGSEASSRMGSCAIYDQNGILCTVRPGKANTEGVAPGVQVRDVLVWTAFLKEHRYGKFYWPPKEADHKLAAEFFSRLPKLLETGAMKPNSTKVFSGGLEDVAKGFQEYREGRISNYKIIYRLQD